VTVKSVVYVIREVGTNHIKIGISRNAKTRLSELQVSNPRRLALVFTFETKHATKLEGELHERYRKHHISGEWFDLNPNKILNDARINTAITQINAHSDTKVEIIPAMRAKAKKRKPHSDEASMVTCYALAVLLMNAMAMFMLIAVLGNPSGAGVSGLVILAISTATALICDISVFLLSILAAFFPQWFDVQPASVRLAPQEAADASLNHT